MAKKPISSKSATSQEIINLDTLSPGEFEKQAGKFNKLPASAKVLIKGKIYTFGKLKATHSKKERQAKKKLKAFTIKGLKELNNKQTKVMNAEKSKLAKNLRKIRKIQSLSRKNKLSGLKLLEFRVSESIVVNRATTTDPVIEGLSANHGKPGEPILIMGRNFGQGIDARYGSKVNLKVPGNETVFPICTAWDEELIEFYIPPEISGISESFEGDISVVRRNCDTPSNTVPFSIDPVIETIILAAIPPTQQRSHTAPIVEISEYFENPGDSVAASCIYREGSGTHFLGSPVTNLIHINRCTGQLDIWPGWLSNCVGNATFFRGYELTNQYWKIEEMRICPRPSLNSDKIDLGSYDVGGTSLEVNVSYDVSTFHQNSQIFISVTGPRGVPFKIRTP